MKKIKLISDLIGKGYELYFDTRIKYGYMFDQSGKNAKKSTTLGYLKTLIIYTNPNSNPITLRKFAKDNKRSTFKTDKKVAHSWLSQFIPSIKNDLVFRESDVSVKRKSTGQTLDYGGFDDGTKWQGVDVEDESKDLGPIMADDVVDAKFTAKGGTTTSITEESLEVIINSQKRHAKSDMTKRTFVTFNPYDPNFFVTIKIEEIINQYYDGWEDPELISFLKENHQFVYYDPKYKGVGAIWRITTSYTNEFMTEEDKLSRQVREEEYHAGISKTWLFLDLGIPVVDQNYKLAYIVSALKEDNVIENLDSSVLPFSIGFDYGLVDKSEIRMVATDLNETNQSDYSYSFALYEKKSRLNNKFNIKNEEVLFKKKIERMKRTAAWFVDYLSDVNLRWRNELYSSNRRVVVLVDSKEGVWAEIMRQVEKAVASGKMDLHLFQFMPTDKLKQKFPVDQRDEELADIIETSDLFISKQCLSDLELLRKLKKEGSKLRVPKESDWNDLDAIIYALAPIKERIKFQK